MNLKMFTHRFAGMTRYVRRGKFGGLTTVTRKTQVNQFRVKPLPRFKAFKIAKMRKF